MRLRSSRSVKAAIATGIVATTIAVASGAALASTVRHDEWWLAPLGVRRAWTASKGAGQIVAVLSDGVVSSHIDLVGSVITGPDYTGTGQSSGPYFGEVGTPIASIIAGHGHAQSDATGMMGVAPLARILSVRVTLPPDDPLLAQSAIASRLPGAIARGIMYAVQHGATVIDLPLDPGQPGVSGTGGATAAQGGSTAEKDAVAYALAHNVVLVAPAGDNGAATDAPNYPAAYPGVIAVGAFGPGFVKAPWTSGQRYVTVTAAGVSMISASNADGYQAISSTSGAAAVVAGIVALIRSSFPELSAAQVRTAIINGTEFRRPGGLADGSGYGAINADRALSAAAAEVPAADRAGAGAQPWVAQPAPGPQSPQSSVTRQIIEAAVISAGILVLLLLLIALYAGVTRRRASRQQQAIAAEWAGRQSPSRYPQAAATDSGQMAEYFAAPAAAPAAGPASAVGGGTAAAPGAFASDPAPATAARRHRATGALGAFAANSAPRAAASPWGNGETVPRSLIGPASRAISRRPAVSGAPPWDPAEQPKGELPWAAAPKSDSGTALGRPTLAAPREMGTLHTPPAGPAPDRETTPAAPTPLPAPELAHMRLAASGPPPAAPPWTPAPAAPAPPASAPPGWDDGPRGGSHAGAEAGDYAGSQDRLGRHSAPDSPSPLQKAGDPLPVRKPGQNPHQPLSPSGSLWERAVEPANRAAESQDTGSRPMLVWQPGDSAGSLPGKSAELRPSQRLEWHVPEDWPGSPGT